MKSIIQSLCPPYDPREARAVVRAVLEDVFHLSYTQQCLSGIDSLTLEQRAELQNIISRLQKGEPVQHITGTATFCGLTFRVTPATLIPRPETEWMVEWTKDKGLGTRGNSKGVTSNRRERSGKEQNVRVLDIGTGSGCIAIAIAKMHPDWEVHACDISPDALAVARQNAADNGVRVNFFRLDILGNVDNLENDNIVEKIENIDKFDILVSNPPYVTTSEARDMAPWVLDHEPHTALFVPDDDPLVFYRAIARHGLSLLAPGGEIALECNTRFTQEVAQLLTSMGYRAATVHRDCYDRPRFVTATL